MWKKSKSYYHALLQADGTKKDKANRRLHVPVSENIYGGMTKEKEEEIQEDVQRNSKVVKDCNDCC